MAEAKPHPANVPGDFYVEDGCCTMCDVPFIEAPKLFGRCEDLEGYVHCYVKRQPQTPAELDRMVSTIRRAEFQCIRYRGADRLLLLRLVETGEAAICDDLPRDLRQRSEQIEVALRQQREPRSSFWGRLSRWWRGGRT